MDTPRRRSDCRRLRSDWVLGRLRGVIGSPTLHHAGAGYRRIGACKRLAHTGTGALGDRPNDFCGAAPSCRGRRMRGGDFGKISMDRDVVVTGYGNIAGNADRCDCAANPDLRANTLDCAVDMCVPRDLLPGHAEYAAGFEERQPASCRSAEDVQRVPVANPHLPETTVGITEFLCRSQNRRRACVGGGGRRRVCGRAGRQ